MNQPRITKIEIVFDGKNLGLNAPVEDKILCLGMLELAKQIILNANKPSVIVPTIIPNHNGEQPS